MRAFSRVLEPRSHQGWGVSPSAPTFCAAERHRAPCPPVQARFCFRGAPSPAELPARSLAFSRKPYEIGCLGLCSFSSVSLCSVWRGFIHLESAPQRFVFTSLPHLRGSLSIEFHFSDHSVRFWESFHYFPGVLSFSWSLYSSLWFFPSRCFKHTYGVVA